MCTLLLVAGCNGQDEVAEHVAGSATAQGEVPTASAIVTPSATGEEASAPATTAPATTAVAEPADVPTDFECPSEASVSGFVGMRAALEKSSRPGDCTYFLYRDGQTTPDGSVTVGVSNEFGTASQLRQSEQGASGTTHVVITDAPQYGTGAFIEKRPKPGQLCAVNLPAGPEVFTASTA